YLQASTTGHHDVMTVPMTHSIAVQTNDGPTDCHHQILYPDQTVDQVKSAFENGSVPHHVMRIERLQRRCALHFSLHGYRFELHRSLHDGRYQRPRIPTYLRLSQRVRVNQ